MRQRNHQSNFKGSEYKWDMTDMPTGIYFVKFKDDIGVVQTIKFIKY